MVVPFKLLKRIPAFRLNEALNADHSLYANGADYASKCRF